MYTQLIKHLESAKSLSSTSLISLYIPSTTRLVDIKSKIQHEKTQAQKIKTKLTRVGIEQALQSIESELKLHSKIPKNGLVIFSGQTKSDFVFESIEPPRPVCHFKYRCESVFCL